jgi:2-iminobutanoate/2-iminopropanoate deaminase
LKIKHLTGSPGNNNAYSPAVRAGDFLFVSGQASVDETGKIIEDSFEGEMRRSLENVQRILAMEGLTLEHVVQVRSYLSAQQYLADYDRVYREYFRATRPARTTLLGVLGTVVKYEIDVVAYDGR